MALGGIDRKIFDPKELVVMAALHPPVFAPGTDWRYSNTNYILAGLIIEKVTGSSLGDQLHTRLFQHLGLDHTTFPTTAQMPEPHARGYTFIESLGYLDLTRTIHPSAYWGAGAIISTAADLSTFYRTLLEGTLLSPELLKEMKTTTVDANGEDTEFGLGLRRLTSTCGIMWGHGGTTPGYHSPTTCSSPDGIRSAVAMINLAPPETWPSSMVEPFNHANAAAMCHALLERAPTAALAETARLERLAPFFDDLPGLAEAIKQAQHATLDLNNLPNTVEPESPRSQ